MAYNENLADRVRHWLRDLPEVEEKEMMGGLVFMYNGKMCVGVVKNDLMCRIDPSIHDEVVERNGCRTMDFTKKPMRGYIFIDETGLYSDTDFKYYIDLALDFNKMAKASSKKRKTIN